MLDTKHKILETAERLFAEQGYSATSMRHIIAEAGVNLAAIHYHFGSKEDLLDELVARRVGPVNRERVAALERCAADPKATVEEIMGAFLLPIAGPAEDHPQFIRLMGRIYAEGLLRGVIEKHFHEVSTRFLAILRKAVPEVPEEEFLWRAHYLFGAVAHTMCGSPLVPPPVGGDFRSRIERLITFAAAGFRAAVTETSEVRG